MSLEVESSRAWPRPHILSILHDPPQLIRLSPLVVSVESLDTAIAPYTSSYIVTDLLIPLLGIKTEYKVHFHSLTDRGIQSVVQAGGGVHLRDCWEVLDAEAADGKCRVRERGEVEAPWWVGWWVRRTWRASHETLMARLEDKLAARESDGS